MFCTTYRVIITFFSCPSRTTRPIACASIEGFHCGSKMCSRLALVRLSLSSTRSAVGTQIFSLGIYPTAPVPIVMSRIATFASFWKREKTFRRSAKEHEPSMRTKVMFRFDMMLARTSRLFTHVEKTILQHIDSSARTS